MTRLTILDLLNLVDKYHSTDTDTKAYTASQAKFYTFLARDELGTFPIGYVLPEVAREFDYLPFHLNSGIHVDHEARTITGFNESTEPQRTEHISKVTKYWRDNRKFDILNKWRDELWPVYGRSGKDVIYSIERVAAGLFGVNRYGVHLQAYVKTDSGIKLWIARRSPTKSTYPGMLDNTAAGGLMTGEDPFECIIREADEEANLPSSVVRENAKLMSTVTYQFISTERSGSSMAMFYPECQWNFDIEISIDIIPVPKDGEVEVFHLWTIDEVLDHMYQGKFKPNCALVLIDFFIRHGVINEEHEHFTAAKSRLRRALPFPGPHTGGY